MHKESDSTSKKKATKVKNYKRVSNNFRCSQNDFTFPQNEWNASSTDFYYPWWTSIPCRQNTWSSQRRLSRSKWRVYLLGNRREIKTWGVSWKRRRGSRCQQCLAEVAIGWQTIVSFFAVRRGGPRGVEIWKESPCRQTAFGARGMKDEKEIEFRSRGLRCTPARGFTLPGSLVLPSSVPSLTVTYRLTDLRTPGAPRRKKPDILQPAPRANRSNEIILYYSDFANLY